MTSTYPATIPALLVHPGPVAEERVVSVPTRLSAYDVELPAGVRLVDALEQFLHDTGNRAATGELVGGELAEFSYYIPVPGSGEGPVATFSEVRTGAAPGRMIRGGLTLGSKDGRTFCHSHSLFVDAHGFRRGGHLVPESVVLGTGVRARMWGAADVAIEVTPDPETTMSLFVPRQVAESGRGDLAAVICRVRPNVDLVTVVEDLAAQQGWDAADVRGQIGSLVGGRLGQPDGSVVDVDGPATEVMFLDGTARRIDGRMTADLSAHLVDRHGIVHRGRVLPGQNHVAMTYELVLTEAIA
jgi:predicted DNA-binding protein with PD1-like motif